MRIFKLVLVLLTIPVLFLSGCNGKTLNYQAVERDNYNTGGNLTFVYDELSHTATFGGEGEIVQFYSKDIAKGWTEEGCRVGVRILIPKEVDDFKSGWATLAGEKLNTEDFFVQTNENSSNYAVFHPIVSQEKSEIDLKIIWQEGFGEQNYHIVIKEGTTFMEKFS